MRLFEKRILLLLELVMIFIVLPILIFYDKLNTYRFVFLFAGVVYCFIILKKDKDFRWQNVWNNFNKKYLKRIIIRSAILTIILFTLVFLIESWNLFEMPQEYKNILPLMVVLYPLFSVLPQEFIYRTFFFQRYEKLIINRNRLIVLSTVLFSLMHIIYRNPVAVITTLTGGYLFSKTYNDTNSLIITVIEHSLYGYLIFISGLGNYFMNANTFELL